MLSEQGSPFFYHQEGEESHGETVKAPALSITKCYTQCSDIGRIAGNFALKMIQSRRGGASAPTQETFQTLVLTGTGVSLFVAVAALTGKKEECPTPLVMLSARTALGATWSSRPSFLRFPSTRGAHTTTKSGAGVPTSWQSDVRVSRQPPHIGTSHALKKEL